MPVDLTETRATAARRCRMGLELGETFAFAFHVAAPAATSRAEGAWEGDDESLHEADALELWDGDGAVRLLRALGPRAARGARAPGDDISALDDGRRRRSRSTSPHGSGGRRARRSGRSSPRSTRWLDRRSGKAASSSRSPASSSPSSVRGPTGSSTATSTTTTSFATATRFVAIDPKPYLADREYDVPSFLWNPYGYRFDDRAQTERRIAAFVGAGLDDFRIRAWTVIRGAYLRTGAEYVEPIRAPRSTTSRRRATRGCVPRRLRDRCSTR